MTAYARLAVQLSISAAIACAQKDTVPLGTTIGAGQVSLPNGVSISAAEMYAAGPSVQPVLNQPYSAQEVVDHLRTMSDGTVARVTDQTAIIFRDSEGRIRTETNIRSENGAVESSLPNFIEIIDPVAGFRYVLDPRSMTGRSAPWPPPKPVRAANATERHTDAKISRANRPAETTRELLGTQYMEGLLTKVIASQLPIS